MTVAITDTRTVFDEADSLTGWTLADTVVTTFFAEYTASVGVAINIGTDQIFHTDAAGVDLDDTTGVLVYVYTANTALQGNWDASVHTLLLGDGTNRVGFDMAGQDRRVFAHSDGPTGFQCFVLDTNQGDAMNTAGNVTVYAGSYASLDYTSIDDIGAGFITLSKALGGGQNVFVDIIRYGNDGLVVAGGTTGARGTFLEIAVDDRNLTTTLKGYGILRELTAGVYGVQGPLTFGDSGSATASYFEDTGVVIAFEDRNISDDKYYLAIAGHATPVNLFSLTGCTIQTGGPSITCNFDGGNFNTFLLDTCVFATGGGALNFSNLADASGHDVLDCTFTGCGQIDPGDVTFSGNTISASTASATGALLLDADGTANWDGITFVSGGTGHGIYITAAGSYTLNGMVFSGYGATTSTDAAVYNNSGGLVTLTITGGASPTYRDGGGASTVINNNTQITLTGLQNPTEVRVYADGTTTELAGSENVTTGSFVFSQPAAAIVDIRIYAVSYLPADLLQFTMPATDSAIPIQQIFDRNYENN